MNSLIVGSDGQDGKLLYEILQKKKEFVILLNRNGIFNNGLNILESKNFNEFEFLKIFLEYKIDLIYFFAAYSKSYEKRSINLDWESKKHFQIESLIKMILKTLSLYNIKVKFFFASSSLIFGGSKESPQSEKTIPSPEELYSISKIKITKFLELEAIVNKNIELYIGIFYNHESIYRGKSFFSRKVIENAIRNYNDSKNIIKLKLENPNSIVDMSHAKDFMLNLYNLVNYGKPGIYIFSSGRGMKVLDFVNEVFDYLNLEFNEYVEFSLNSTSNNKIKLIGDNNKLVKELGDLYTYSHYKLSHRLTLEWLKFYGIK